MNRIDNNQLGILNWEDFEKAVKAILKSAGAIVEKFKVNGKKKFISDDGEYEIDASVEFIILGGAKFFALVECRAKKTGNRVEREEVLAFHSKMMSLRAQKGIFFTTSSYQIGAIEYAKKHSIALVQVVDGKSIYITKGAGTDNVLPPKWLKLPEYAGWLIDLGVKDSISYSLARPEINKNLFGFE